MKIFSEIPCLTERSSQLNAIVLQKKWFPRADKRYITQYLHKFINYNKRLFDFLDVTPQLNGSDKNTSLSFRTSSFVGAIPLISSDTGRQIGDFIVTPRYSGHNKYEDYTDILNLLEDSISPEMADSIPLSTKNVLRPPLYLESVNFINALATLVNTNWVKFDSKEKYSQQPTGCVNWYKYASRSHKVEQRLIFPVNKSILSELHSEYSQIRYVYDICKNELNSYGTPARIKSLAKSKMSLIDKKLYLIEPLYTPHIDIKFYDSPSVKKCKTLANKILNFNLDSCPAWRVDFSLVFEKLVQHVFDRASKVIGGAVVSNHQLKAKELVRRPSWVLHHLEPDAVYIKNELVIYIDAKYKSNLYNRRSESLKDDHRHDVHQILAYSSFGNASIKHGFLCYPSTMPSIDRIRYENTLNNTINIIYICGIPMKKRQIPDAVTMLCNTINEIRTTL